MGRSLGVHCTPKAAYMAVAEDGVILATGPQKVDVPDGLRTGSSLAALNEELHRRLVEVGATDGAVLLPQTYDAGSKAAIARIGLETVLRLVANDLGLEIELLNRSTARSRLGIDRSGTLDDRVKQLFPSAIGKYWAEGRRYAAFAALACEIGAK
jgi:hypothetical protein